jgi:hypothetical protein
LRFRKRSGAGSQARKQQRDWKRSADHHAMIAAMERLHDDALLTGPGCTHDTSPPLTPPLPALASPSPPPPARSDAVRAVRRLPLGEFNAPQEDESCAPSRSASPVIRCSQFRQQQCEEAIRRQVAEEAESRYPTPPAAPRKDQYISESDLESDCAGPSESPPSALFRNGKLYVHKDYKGQIPLCHYATGLPAGHPHDFYACYSQRDVVWANRVRFHIERLQAALPARGQGAVSYRVRP